MKEFPQTPTSETLSARRKQAIKFLKHILAPVIESNTPLRRDAMLYCLTEWNRSRPGLGDTMGMDDISEVLIIAAVGSQNWPLLNNATDLPGDVPVGYSPTHPTS